MDDCAEARVFYRLVSGMHASISAHISANYLLDEEGFGVTWGKNLTDFQHRLGTVEVRERVQNLYFAYLFVLRAVVKAGPLLQRLDYFTGLAKEDARTQELIDQLVSAASGMLSGTGQSGMSLCFERIKITEALARAVW